MSRKKSIGLLVSFVESPYFSNMIRGAKMAAEEHDVNLLIIPGYNMLSQDSDDGSRPQYEFQANTLFSYVSKKSVDVVIASPGSICLDGTRTHEFMDLLKEVPVLTVADKTEGYPYIQYDNSYGIIEAMNYLIKEKGCRNIGMISGPNGNADATQRLQAYRECLRINGIGYDENKVVFGNFMSNCFAEARDLLERNPGLEAVLCANDLMAQALYHVLDEYDKVVGRDIYVVGFDDDIGSADMEPPLATVRADAVNLGYEALMLASRMADGEVPSPKILRTEFINRESAGFRPYFSLAAIEKRQGVGINTVFNVEGICDTMMNFIFTGLPHDYQAECQKKLLENLILRLLTRYFGNVLKRNSDDDIYLEFSNLIDRGAMNYVDSKRLFKVFDTIYHVYCEKDMTLSGRAELSELLSRLKMRVVEYLDRKAGDLHKVTYSMLRSMNWLAGNLMMMSGDPELQYEKFMKGLSAIGVMNAYIFEWEKPVMHKRGQKWVQPEHILVKAYRNRMGTVHVPRSLQRIMTTNLLDNRFMEGGRTYQWLLMGFYYMDLQFGLLLVDLDAEYYSSFEFISNQLNITMRNIIILNDLKLEKQGLREEAAKHAVAADSGMALLISGIGSREQFTARVRDIISEQAETGRIMIMICLDMDKALYGRDDQEEIAGKGIAALKRISGADAAFGYAGCGRFLSFFHSDDLGCREKSELQLNEAAQEIGQGIRTAVSEFRYHDDLMAEDMILETIDIIDFLNGEENALL